MTNLRLVILFVLNCLTSYVIASDKSEIYDWKHHDNRELNELLQKVNDQCPSITRLYELNERSVKGWPLTVIEITDFPGQHETRKCKQNII